jgi:hypothetical protein
MRIATFCYSRTLGEHSFATGKATLLAARNKLTHILPMALLLTCSCTTVQADESVWIRQQGFAELAKGTADDAGANLYVSAKGRIQTINRMDLNLDGELDLMFTQDHNDVYNPDAMIYWGGEPTPSTPGGFHSLLPDMSQWRSAYSLLKHSENASKHITRLPSDGGGRAAVADLNRDGFLDIVFGNTRHYISVDMPAYVYWGSATGFQPEARTELPALRAFGVAVGDLNGDGFLAVVLANSGEELVTQLGLSHHLESYIYWGDANGYTVARRTSIPTISAADVALGDFNGDGKPDLAFANYNASETSVYIYWGNGSESFTTKRRQVLGLAELNVPIGSSMNALLAADLNGDGLMDLTVAGGPKARVYLGTAAGLDVAHGIDLPAAGAGAMAAADLNNDGQADLVITRIGGGQSTIYWGNSKGFDAARHTNLPTGQAATVDLADVNDDGAVDILFGDKQPDSAAYIYWGNGNDFAPYRRSSLHSFGVIGSAVADLDADGKQDIVFVNWHSGSGYGRILPATIFWGNPDHYYSAASTTELDAGATMSYSIGDLDDDGFPDLLFHASGVPWIWWGAADGYRKEQRTELQVKGIIASKLADLNRDGFLDIVFTSGGTSKQKPARGVIVWGNAKRFDKAKVTEFILQSLWLESVYIADLNRDNKLDLIFPMSMKDHSEIYYGSDQGYGPKTRTLIEANGAAHAAVADLDADGWLDLILTSAPTSTTQSANTKCYIYFGGPKGFSPKHRAQIDSFTPLDATVADFNRDGHLDIALGNYRSDQTRELPALLYWGDGKRNYSERNRTILPAANSGAVRALDLNRDGWPELVVSNHQILGDHGAGGTNIFWGAKQGFSPAKRTHLPTIGVHLTSLVDLGNIYHRRNEQDYISTPLQAPNGTVFEQLHWKAETKLSTTVKFQVRTAPTHSQLSKATWTGPAGPQSFYTQAGTPLTKVPPKHRWLQYRARLTSPDGGNSAVLTEVAIRCGK